MFFISGFILKFKNAKAVVRQIQSGEWDAIVNVIGGEIYTAERNGYRLWLANGPFFCEIDEFNGEKCAPAFGLVWRHYVWWMAARNIRLKKHVPIL